MTKIVPFDRTNIEGTLFINEDMDELYIEVESTNVDIRSASPHENDWLRTSLNAWPVRVGLMVYHRGFYHGWLSMEDLIHDILTEHSSIKKVYCYGMSLGGAISGVAAYEIKKYYPKLQVWHWSFGGPRFLYLLSSRLQYQKKITSKIYRYGQDIVPTAPPWWWRAWHSGNVYRLPSEDRWSPSNYVNHHYGVNYLKALGSATFHSYVVEEVGRNEAEFRS